MSKPRINTDELLARSAKHAMATMQEEIDWLVDSKIKDTTVTREGVTSSMPGHGTDQGWNDPKGLVGSLPATVSIFRGSPKP